LQLLHMVGRGGRGSVYRAWQPSLRRVVAVKILSRALSGNREYIQRFIREARVASKAAHRNIVRAFDINKKGADVYMVMEYVSGISLGAVLRSRQKLAAGDVLAIAALVGDAISYIAKVGLVHRDIKPDNIMIDRKGRVKLCDLGLARPSGGANLTSPMVAQGTPAYMAPENALGHDIDSQADVYSLGVTMYRAALGKLPFDNPDPVEVLRMHVEEEPRGLDGGELPGALADLIRRMLAKDPKARPPARELGRELAALQKTLPGMDHPKLYELVPGGAPTAIVAYQSELDLEEPQPQAPPQPAYKAWEDPTLAPRPAVTRRPLPLPGMGVGTLVAALILCIAYILFVSLSGPATPPEDPRVGELQKQVSDLEARLATAELERKTVATLMHEAAERLKLENQEDLRRKEVEPPRQKLDDVIPELAAMRKAQSLNSK
ncbi:MAG: serine/threonine protein kinase, partial [Planctomycetes bacterium]|nr:serine/threonine protein kinase [Planctomycetota bacterium]